MQLSPPNQSRKSALLAALALCVIALAAAAQYGKAADTLTLNGAGATFPYPIYSKWFAEYKKANPHIEINYQSIGSGGGIRQLLDKTVDFGASDAPMTDEQLGKANPPVLHFPTVLGAVVITYNLPEMKGPLHLSSDVIAEIFLGKITNWNDPKIAALNSGIALPKDLAILVAHRSDGSGTTNVFADYLAKTSPDWKTKVGVGTALNWPVGLGGKGNEGVTGLVKQSPGAIGYIELTYAKSNKLPFATIRNKAGKFIEASPVSVTAAAQAAAKTLPKDFRASITDEASPGAYPIASFTYLLVYTKMPAAKGKTLKEFLKWAYAKGQTMAEPLQYAPLPPAMIKQVEAEIGEIKTE